MHRIKIIFSVLGILFMYTGCAKKLKDHTITYKYKLLDLSKFGAYTGLYVGVAPSYRDVENMPKLGGSSVETWEYTYIGLQDGDYVIYEIQIPLSIYFEMSIFIDGKEVLYRRIKASDSHYYSGIVVESRGIDTLSGMTYLPGDVRFVYHEVN